MISVLSVTIFVSYFPMQGIGYFRNLLYVNEKSKICFHFCPPPIVPEIFEETIRNQSFKHPMGTTRTPSSGRLYA